MWQQRFVWSCGAVSGPLGAQTGQGQFHCPQLERGAGRERQSRQPPVFPLKRFP